MTHLPPHTPAARTAPSRNAGRWVPFLTGAAVCFGLACVAGRAWPQSGQCGPRASVGAHLTTKYDETVQSIGMAANNTVLELWANAAAGTWTITVTTPHGMTCLLASGTHYEAIAPEPDGVPG